MRPASHIGVARFAARLTSVANPPSPSRSIQIVPAVPPRYRFQRAGSPELRPMTTPRPAGSHAIARAGPTRMGAGATVPDAATAWRWEYPRNGWPASDATTTDEESGVQATVVVIDPSQVMRVGAPPCDATTYASAGPSSRPVNAIVRPSGENTGNVIAPGLAVRRRGTPPATGTSQRSPSQTKTIRSPWIAGCR